MDIKENNSEVKITKSQHNGATSLTRDFVKSKIYNVLYIHV